MGIKGLNQLLKKECPNAFVTMSALDFKDCKIAIDGCLWMHANMAVIRKISLTTVKDKYILNEEGAQERWLTIARNFVAKFRYHNITPVFVFDGETPVEKLATVAKRHEKQTVRLITDDNYKALLQLLEELEVQVLIAKGDGEQLCSALCIAGDVKAVWSTDTDNLVYGCPILITGIKDLKYDCVILNTILEDMALTQAVFVDLCIMSGCDYNTNMPRIAAVTSLKLLRKYGSIEEIEIAMPKLDTSCLLYKRCREMFA